MRSEHHLNNRNLRSSVLLLGLAAVASCSSRSNSPLPPQVALHYVGRSGANLIFKLENGTSEAVSFRGLGGLTQARPLAGVTSELECRKASTERWWPEAKIEEAGPETIEVVPGARLQLEVDGTYTREYQGGQCHLRLRLQSGASIESDIFVP